MAIHHISIWRRSSNKLRQSEIWLEYLCLIGLSLAALTLFLVNLSDLPLIDYREATLATVAREIHQSSNLINWIFPTLWNEPYLDKPPLGHILVAIAYKIGGINEFTTRFPGALLGALSVLLLYQIGREIFIARLPALYGALVYLTCLPVVRYSRLATLDGPLLCFQLLTVWAALRSRRDLNWTLVTGIGFSLMSLTQSWFSLQFLLLVFLFLFWDTPRLLSSAFFWIGLAIGVLPSFAWYFGLLIHYRTLGFNASVGNLLSTPSETIGVFSDHRHYFLQGLQYFVPWLAISFAGIQPLKHNLHWGWGKLLAVWLGGYLTLGLLLQSSSFWLALPIYPALALAAGKQLDRIRNLPSFVTYPRLLIYGFASMAILAALGGVNWGVYNYVDFYLPFICGSLCITFGATAVVIAQRDKQFIPLLFWGLLVSLFLLVVSPHWIWELKFSSSVEPVAASIAQHTPPTAIIYSSPTAARPSLSFYSERKFVTQSVTELKQRWQQETLAYFLFESQIARELDLSTTIIIEDKRLDSAGLVLAIEDRSSVLADFP